MRKMDENEKQLSLYAIKSTYLYTLIVELFYFIYTSIRAGEFLVSRNPIFYLMVTQNLVYSISSYIINKKISKDHDNKSFKLGLMFALLFIILGLLFTKTN